MPLLLSQLVHTSFQEVGFRTLASAKVPKEIQQAFIQKVVNQYWDSYNPLKSKYQAAYLHQVTLEDSLFGWLYNEGKDELGRCNVPYFICYYLAKRLHHVHLENIFTCLHRGPVALIDRQSFPATLETIIVAPDLWSYQPARIGVEIPSDVRERSHVALKQRRLLDLFFLADEEQKVIVTPAPQAKPSVQNHIPVVLGNLSKPPLGEKTTDASVTTKKSALLIGIATGVASALFLIIGVYYFLLSPAPDSKAQQHPFTIHLQNR